MSTFIYIFIYIDTEFLKTKWVPEFKKKKRVFLKKRVLLKNGFEIKKVFAESNIGF